MENKICYVLIDKNSKELCGVYRTYAQVIYEIDKLHRKEIEDEMTNLRQKILDDPNDLLSAHSLQNLETNLKYYHKDNPIKYFLVGQKMITNYLFYGVEFDTFKRTFLHFN